MRIPRTLILAGGVLAGTLALSCGGGGDSGGAVTVSAEAKAEAQSIFDTRCATCHGKTGVGDGPGAAALNPKPRNYTDKAWQGTVNDEYLAKVIVKGGAAVGLSVMMTANPDLESKPEVVQGLVQIVRSFGK
jgi:mono/diheme cytochrome c family protein